MFGSRGSMSGFQQPKLSFTDRLGLVGDILTGNRVTGNRLDEDFQRQAMAYQSAHPNPVAIGNSLVQFDPATNGVNTLYTAPAKLDPFGEQLKAAGIDPASEAGQSLYRQRIQNDVDPVRAYPTTDASGNQGLLFKRSSELGQTAPAGVTFTPRSGGAAQGGPGGFPLYPRSN